MNDGELLRRYREAGDERAFAELVERHLGLVHATAQRRTGDAHAAADISQAVFCLLLRKGRPLQAATDLTGWLHRAACFKAAEWLRAERRRRVHEQEAAAMPQDTSADPAPWTDVAPLLDEALDRLGKADRQLLLLRFFRRLPLRDVGHQLGISEDAARMRVTRALERLRVQLARAGAPVGPAALGAWLEQHAAPPAPPALPVVIREAARKLRVTPAPLSFADRLAEWAALSRPRPAMLVVTGALIVGSVTLWRLTTFSNEVSVSRHVGGPGELVPQARSVVGSIPGVRVLSIVPRTDAVMGRDALLDDLRRILNSPVPDHSWPPSDLRLCVTALAGYPDATLAVLVEVLRDSRAPQPARERAIWGLWLLGDAALAVVPDAIAALADVLRSAEGEALWSHAADVLLHLQTPPDCLPAVAAAVADNPAVARRTLRFWRSAYRQHRDSARELLASWLNETDDRRFVAACVLATDQNEPTQPLVPLILAALDDPRLHLDALDSLKEVHPGAVTAEVARDLRARLAEAERRGQGALQRQLVEVLATLDPESRADLPEVDQLLRVRAEAEALRSKMRDDTATIAELAAGLSNPEVGWEAALALQELGPAAAAALPALRQALAETDAARRSYFAEAIKAIEPNSPKPRYDRDDLMIPLRRLSDALAELKSELTEYHHALVARYVREAGEQTPFSLAERARELGEIHPRLREAFVSGLLAVDPALEQRLNE